MKRQILLMLFFVIFASGCGARQCYKIPDFSTTICIVDDISLRERVNRYLNEGYDIVITERYKALRKNIVTSLYIPTKDLLITQNNPHIIFTQLWYMKNKTAPKWPLKGCKIISMKSVKENSD